MSGGEILEFLQRNERRRELGADHDRFRRQKVADKPSEDLPILLVQHGISIAETTRISTCASQTDVAHRLARSGHFRPDYLGQAFAGHKDNLDKFRPARANNDVWHSVLA